MKLTYYWSKVAKRLQGKAIRGSKISKNAYVNYGSNIVNSSMGDYSYCGYDCWFIEAEIGKYCCISNQVHIGGPAHPTNWVSMSPLFQKGRNVFAKHFAELDFNPFCRTIIGNDVWIGENAMIKSGVTIGNGAVIGMGSIVTKDIPSYEIWAGNPAKKIGNRFEPEMVLQLEQSQWWDLSEAELKQRATLFSNPIEFLQGNTK